MEIVLTAVSINIGIACVFFLAALVMGFKCPEAAFLLGETHYCILWYYCQSFPSGAVIPTPLFCAFVTIAITDCLNLYFSTHDLCFLACAAFCLREASFEQSSQYLALLDFD